MDKATSDTRTGVGSDARTEFPHLVLLLTAGAILLRLLLFLGRGDYVAFDEGWYLLLGRNLWSGNGYSLSGLQHVALSPLFPILAGGLGRLIGDTVWAGRIVAGVSAGLLVLPCWSIFNRLAGARVARAATLFVVVMPALAPFVVPYWVGWDLWVGAEPLLHLFLFSGIALFLRGWAEKSLIAAVACGVAFALAYLARPEAVVTLGLLGILAVVSSLPRPGRRAGQIGACALAFVLVAAPYWTYLHDALGRWTITGRAVQLTPRLDNPVPRGARPRSNRIEDMLWQGDASPYVRRLFALNAAGTSLANGYWGVRRADAGTPDGPEDPTAAPPEPRTSEASSADGGPDPSRGEREPVRTPASLRVPKTEPAADGSSARGGAEIQAPSRTGNEAPPPTAQAPGNNGPLTWLFRYGRALGIVAPWYLWIFVVPGVLIPAADRRLRLEALTALPLVGTSILIANAVAIDPRTQLFMAPLAAFYTARGALAVAGRLKERMGDHLRRDTAQALIVGTLAVLLVGTSGLRLYLSLSVGSPHHIVGAENARVGAAIRDATPPNATVMSWHPAVALFADRDWRVLPLEPMSRIVRYARLQPDPYVVLSVFYPPRILQSEEPHYLVVRVPSDLPGGDSWRIDIPEARTTYSFGTLIPVS